MLEELSVNCVSGINRELFDFARLAKTDAWLPACVVDILGSQVRNNELSSVVSRRQQ